jgi:hypothetical protein
MQEPLILFRVALLFTSLSLVPAPPLAGDLDVIAGNAWIENLYRPNVAGSAFVDVAASSPGYALSSAMPQAGVGDVNGVRRAI